MTNKQLTWNEQIIEDFRANNGNVETNGFGESLILVHHTGARTNEHRLNPLRAVFDGDRTWWVVASNQGAESNPDWYFNLLANPDTAIEVPGKPEAIDVSAELLIGNSREAAWNAFTAQHPIFLQYQDETERVFPVFALNEKQ